MRHSLPRLFSPARPVLLLLLLGAAFFHMTGIAPAAPLLLNDGRNAPASKGSRELALVLESLSGGRATVIALQRELVSRPAVGPEYGGAGEEEKARWLEGWLTGRGLACERLDFPDERVPAKVRPNIVAVFPGTGPDKGAERTLWLVSHLDVAAAGPRELWNGDPFALRVDGDALYGRGVEDNNQAIVSSLLLVDSLRTAQAAPPLRLGIVLTSGALTDYRVGIGHLLSRKPELFKPDDVIVVMDYGNQAGSLVSVGEKGNIWLKITVTGTGGHAGTSDGSGNAFAAGAALAHGLRGLEKEFPAENPLFTPPRTVVTPTRTEDFSTGVNHASAKFIFYADARVMADYSYEAVEKAVRTLADAVETSHGVSIGIERVEETPSSRVTPANAPVLQSLDRAIRAQLGVEPVHTGTGSVTVAATLRAKGLNAAVWGVQETLHNKPEERALISAHIKQAQVLARILFDPLAANGATNGPAGDAPHDTAGGGPSGVKGAE